MLRGSEWDEYHPSIPVRYVLGQNENAQHQYPNCASVVPHGTALVGIRSWMHGQRFKLPKAVIRPVDLTPEFDVKRTICITVPPKAEHIAINKVERCPRTGILHSLHR
jgi:hypothetical protein